MPSIVTLTMNPSLDIASETDRVVPDDKLRCDPPQYDPGGGGINVARALKMLGGHPLAIFPAAGPSGELIGSLLRNSGVDFRAIPIHGTTRENIHIVESSTGKQFRFVMAGPTLSNMEQTRCLRALAATEPAPRFVVASGSLPPGVTDSFYAEVASLCGRMGAKLVLDASGDALKVAGRGVYLLKPSLAELEELVGRALTSPQSQETAARDLIEDGRAEILVVSLGKDGALVATPEGEWRLPAINVPVRSTVGAGDSMVAGTVMALTRGWTILDAVRYGIAAASAALMHPGTQLCRLADVERLYAANAPVARAIPLVRAQAARRGPAPVGESPAG